MPTPNSLQYKSGHVVQPQPGETWQHSKHGSVRIVRAMSEGESWCELPGGRRLPIYNCFLIFAVVSPSENHGQTPGGEHAATVQPISETETQT